MADLVRLNAPASRPARNHPSPAAFSSPYNHPLRRPHPLNSIVYIVGAGVIVIAVLSFFGLR
jgi:hypothetical protein